jgi:hypothetical protein
MLNAPPDGFWGVLNQPPGGGKLAQNAKKILNRRNEAKILLKINGLTFLEAQNEPNSECEKRQSKRNIQPRIDELFGTE